MMISHFPSLQIKISFISPSFNDFDQWFSLMTNYSLKYKCHNSKFA